MMAKHEVARGEFAPAPRKNLPLRILRAFDNAKHINTLPRSVRDTLAEIVRYLPQNRPFDTVFAHKRSIAERIGASERTVHRHLVTLQVEKLIVVHKQERKSRNGRFAVSRISITSWCAELLGLVENEDNSAFASSKPPFTAQSGQETSPEATSNTSHLGDNHSNSNTLPHREDPAFNEGNLQIIHKQPPDKLSGGYMITKPTYTNTQCSVPSIRGLPEDLMWLCHNGISKAGVFKLMGAATAQGKRLSDIVIVVEEYIRKLKGKHLYGYLGKLVNGPTCFQIAACNERKRRNEVKVATELKIKEAIFRKRFGNTTIINRSRSILYRISENGNFAEVFTNNRSGYLPLNDLRPFILGLESGELFLATDSIELQFSENRQEHSKTSDHSISNEVSEILSALKKCRRPHSRN